MKTKPKNPSLHILLKKKSRRPTATKGKRNKLLEIRMVFCTASINLHVMKSDTMIKGR